MRNTSDHSACSWALERVAALAILLVLVAASGGCGDQLAPAAPVGYGPSVGAGGADTDPGPNEAMGGSGGAPGIGDSPGTGNSLAAQRDELIGLCSDGNIIHWDAPDDHTLRPGSSPGRRTIVEPEGTFRETTYFGGFRNEFVDGTRIAVDLDDEERRWVTQFSLLDEPLGVGSYRDDNTIGGPRMAFSVDFTIGCDRSCGSFEVFAFETTDTPNLLLFAAVFDFQCGCEGPVLIGCVRYESPLYMPEP